jgi:uncharacterized protein (DUF952 family)
VILHICPRGDWDARSGGVLAPASLDTEGFAHCSDPGTVALPAGRLFAGRTDLLLLEIDPARLDVPVRWEPGTADGRHEGAGGPWFPHVYGPIPDDAVVAVHAFPPESDGSFRLPPTLADPSSASGRTREPHG